MSLPALILIHPLGGSPRFWDSCRAIWGDRYRTETYDWSGAEAVGNDLSLLPNAERIEAMRLRLGLDEVVPAGVAVGAMIAASYAARHPRHVPALILSNPAIALSPASRTVTEARVERVRSGGVDTILPEAVDRAFNGMPREAAYDKYMLEFRGNAALAYEKNALAALEMDIASELERIVCPTLVIAGEHDILLPPAEAERVAARLRTARYRALPASHFPPIQTPATFAAEVDAFLASIPGGG